MWLDVKPAPLGRCRVEVSSPRPWRRAKAPAALAMTLREFETDSNARRELYRAASGLRAEQHEAMGRRLKTMGIEAQVDTKLKRQDFPGFCRQIAFKVRRKDYPRVGRMVDIARGRISVRSWSDVERIVKALRALDEVREVKPPQPRENVPWGYPRIHVVLVDPSTTLTFEWQIGTHATEIVFGHAEPGIELHGIRLPPDMKPNFQSLEYKCFRFMQYHPDPTVTSLARELGVPKLRRELAELAQETAMSGGKQSPQYWLERTDALHREASRIVKGIVQARDLRLIESLLAS